ncbi:hypothetical protein EDM52_22920 [Brevibacillus invocatus]|uniref:Uncharacterized protein n=1 Tax=Brevibacillus invocatus TaxID=173959 RepID=A0A3M8BV25_9BACL|nr:hypothetical protein EDM52_22920 [Brevibacillus invocatus]
MDYCCRQRQASRLDPIHDVRKRVALPCLDAFITEGIKKEERGTISAIYSSMRFIGVALGPQSFLY